MQEYNALYKRNQEDEAHYNHISSLIKSKNFKSLIPYYECDIEGHQSNQLDTVCIDNDCKNKGIVCFRCQYQKHREHNESCIPFDIFLANLINGHQQSTEILIKNRENSYKLREALIESVKNYVEKLIDQFCSFVASIHKYYQTQEERIEELILKSDIVMHRLFYKKHINHYQLNDYITDIVKKIDNFKEKNKNYNFQEKTKNIITLMEYESAIKISEKNVQDMFSCSTDLKTKLDYLRNESAQLFNLKIVNKNYVFFILSLKNLI